MRHRRRRVLSIQDLNDSSAQAEELGYPADVGMPKLIRKFIEGMHHTKRILDKQRRELKRRKLELEAANATRLADWSPQ